MRSINTTIGIGIPMEQPIKPSDGMVIRSNTVFEPGTYFLPNGIRIASPGITVDGRGAVLVGLNRQGVGITLQGCDGVTLRHITLLDYRWGIRATECEGITIHGHRVADTAELAPNTVFLDIWLDEHSAYGAAIVLADVRNSIIEENDLQHQQNGILAYRCTNLVVRRNEANYNSGFGFYLSATCNSVFEENSADYCCRFEPRPGGLHYGHMGADAAGFVAVRSSCGNRFLRNTARMGGDGFFLAGLAPDGTPAGCNNNLFEANDASLSPNIAFEATFCSGNTFRRNNANRSNYGFWLGYSWDTLLEENQVLMNRQAGIAAENAHGCRVEGNTFQGNGHGLLLWSRFAEEFLHVFPNAVTSFEWTILSNTFLSNGTAIRIAADQDHGIRPATPGPDGRTRPRNHEIRRNNIQNNRVGLHLTRCDTTLIEENILNGNVEANLRIEDCMDTIVRNNLGSAGGYL
ncbi:MAG: right-handed parallel beta-helix repeat-containing protein [Chthonomonadales bacterium]